MGNSTPPPRNPVVASPADGDWRSAFVVGAYWTPERARQATTQMSLRLASPSFQTLLRQVAVESADASDSAGRVARHMESALLPARVLGPITASTCRYRRGRPADLDAVSQLIAAGDLPPLFVEEFIEGFVVVEQDGQLIGCGGLEIYDDCGVLRSVVVDPVAQRQGIGERIVSLLVAEAQHAQLSALALFTVHAHALWCRLGFVDIPIADWPVPARQSWQYWFLTTYPQAAQGVHTMWRPLTR